MSLLIHRSSRPHSSILPRSNVDAHRRYMIYGPIQPMDEPRGLLSRLFGRAI